VHAAGLPSLRRTLVDLVPWLADRVETHLTDWKQTFLLSVESDRLVRWYRPGLLLIGDAAHTMSPVGGVGINYAIQDAVAAANLLSDGLLAGRLSLHQLAAVQRRREFPTRVIQTIQTQIQNRVLAPALASRRKMPQILPLLARVPFLRRLPPRIMAMGIRTEHVR
jgi:2-polyprenyl-6-methoxyphenol hydroxylase-like FAD-dependent oxidoreductase